jgi:hypothetical protein
MEKLHLPECLEASQRILVAGAGGGYDVYAGLPIFHRLRALGKQVFLANLSFTYLRGTDAPELTPSLFLVDATARGDDLYFPERELARFLNQSIYTFENVGAKPVGEAYHYLRNRLGLDAVVLVDGGTDILLRGDEASLGTPAEDMVSLAAVKDLDIQTRLVFCVGFGIDTFHGVCHAHWLENVADFIADGAFLGAVALRKNMPEVKFYLDAVVASELLTKDRSSIVNGCIASAIEGKFGNFHRSTRTKGSELFINPLMSLLWAFDLAAVARRNLYLDNLAETTSHKEVLYAIEQFHANVPHRPRKGIPH